MSSYYWNHVEPLHATRRRKSDGNGGSGRIAARCTWCQDAALYERNVEHPTGTAGRPYWVPVCENHGERRDDGSGWTPQPVPAGPMLTATIGGKRFKPGPKPERARSLHAADRALVKSLKPQIKAAK